uniref:DUF3778 domain-containing protein n=1 Tax=Oryza barthii TaxID=65489 RepID=A0A0D3FMN3_9ORYZ
MVCELCLICLLLLLLPIPPASVGHLLSGPELMFLVMIGTRKVMIGLEGRFLSLFLSSLSLDVDCWEPQIRSCYPGHIVHALRHGNSNGLTDGQARASRFSGDLGNWVLSSWLSDGLMSMRWAA